MNGLRRESGNEQSLVLYLQETEFLLDIEILISQKRQEMETLKASSNNEICKWEDCL